jgi:hypothetical protein
MAAYKISHELAQDVLNYLVQRPFNEVAGYVQQFTQLEELADEPEEENTGA